MYIQNWHNLIVMTYTEFQKDERISKIEIYQHFGGLKPTLALLFRCPCMNKIAQTILH